MKSTRIIAAVLAGMLSLSLAACGDQDGNDSASKPKDTTAAAAGADESGSDETAPAETAAPADETTAAETEEPEAPLPEEDPPVEEEIKSPELKEIGKMNGEGINFYHNITMYTGESEESVNCLNYLGEDIDGGDVPYVGDFKYTPGVYAYCKKGDGIVYQGLMDADGNIILSADQGVGTFEGLNDRYVKAYFPEGVTESKEDAIYFVTANQFSFMPSDNDILYKGTVKVFDLEQKKFLENTAENFDPNYTPHGDIISYFDAESNLKNVRADDTLVDENREYTITGEEFFTKTGSDKNEVYDHDLKKLFSTPYYVYEMSDSDYYYRIQDGSSSMSGIMSKMGRVIIEPKYKAIMGVCENYFSYSNEDTSKTGLLRADGTELTKDEYKYFTELAPGLFSAKNSDDNAVMIDKDGNVIFTESESEKLYAYSGISPYITKDGKSCYYVYGKGDFSLEQETSGENFGKYILYSYKDKAIYNLVTGEIMLDGFDKAYMAYGRVYVLNGDEYTIYEIV